MSVQSGILKTRLERLLDERDTVSKLHDDLLAHVEHREGEQGLTEIEEKQINDYRDRAKQLDDEVAELNEHLEREKQSEKTSQLVRTNLAGRAEGVDVEGDEIRYRSFATFARDYILARGPGQSSEQIRSLAGGDDAAKMARERLLRMQRTPANTLSSNVLGLQPEQHIAQIFQVIDDSRPLVASATRATLNRGSLTFPQIVTRPVVAVQATQKTEGGNQGMVINMVTATASTYLGGGDLSWQAVEWSDPNALDLWFRLAAADYALKTEQDAGEVIQTAAFLNDISTLFGATGTFAEFMTAVGAGMGAVYANSGDIADTLYLAPDRAFYIMGITSAAFPMFTDGSMNVNGLGGTVAGLNVVVSRGLDAGVIAVGKASQLIVAETAGAPVQLRVTEPAIGGYEVGIIGAFEAVVTQDESFALLTAAS
jgi:hypothetical protein